MTKEITRPLTMDKYLRALALFTMAAEHAAKCKQFETQLAELLKMNEHNGYAGCVSDEMYTSNGAVPGIDAFNRGLTNEHFEIPEWVFSTSKGKKK